MPLVPSDDKDFTAFVEQILSDPRDVTRKLVFADWLDDLSDPRAPLLRVVHNVRQQVGPYEPLEGPPRTKIRDSKDPLLVRTGPIPKGWKWPYPDDKRIPDITRPKLESVRGAHGSGRLLSIALITDLVESFDSYKAAKLGWFYTAVTATELYACRLISTPQRNYAIGKAYMGEDYGKPRSHLDPGTDEKDIRSGQTVDFKFRGIARTCASISWELTDYCLSGRFGSFVNAAHAYEKSLMSRSWWGRRGTVPWRQVHWHLRSRTTKTADAWKAMTPWLDGKRVWDAEEETKQNSPPKSDQHKRYQVHVGKYPCDHRRVDGRSAYETWTAPDHGLGLFRLKQNQCRICDDVKPTGVRRSRRS